MPNSKSVKNNCIINNKTKRCVLNDKPNSTSKHCYRKRTTKRCNTYPTEFNETIVYKGITMTKKAKQYLEKIIINKSSSQIKKMRKIHEDNELYIPIDKYTTDNSLKDYLIHEIVDLAKNYSVDNKVHMITIKAIKYVIKEDKDLDTLLHH